MSNPNIIAFQVDDFQSVAKTNEGSILRSNTRPSMSFDYEVLTFTSQMKSRFWQGAAYDLTEDQITEVQAYIDTIESDPLKSELMSKIHQARKLLASTDWYVTRLTETGQSIPANITLLRQKARETINEAQQSL